MAIKYYALLKQKYEDSKAAGLKFTHASNTSSEII